MNTIWKNKGHEFDKLWKGLKNQNDSLKICIYYSGSKDLSIVRRMQEIYAFAGDFSVFVIDNERYLECIDEIKTVPLSDLEIDKCILVFPEDVNTDSLYSQKICKRKLKEFRDYYRADYFIGVIFPVILLYAKDYLYDKYVQIELTRKCTLKCEKCAHLCVYTNKNARVREELTLQEAIDSVDSYFKVVDTVGQFDVLGGEPLVYPYLNEFLSYLTNNYGKRIVQTTITTNCTVIPSEDLLKICKEGNILFVLSDYSRVLEGRSSYAEIIKERLKRDSIRYWHKYTDGKKWVDLGFTEIDKGRYYASHVYKNCRSGCTEIRNGRYYFCIMARCASEILFNDEGKFDCLSLEKLDNSMGKKTLYEYSMGYNEKGYLEMCKHCRGMNAPAKYFVEPGVQING